MHTYDINLANYIRLKGLDQQAFIDAFPLHVTDHAKPKAKPSEGHGHGYRGPKMLNEAERVEICDMYRNGDPIKRIADRFNMRTESVNKVLNSANVSRTRKSTRPIDHERATSLLLAGVGYCKVAEILGCSPHAMRMRRRELIEVGRLREGK